jgi:hypothetical protein
MRRDKSLFSFTVCDNRQIAPTAVTNSRFHSLFAEIFGFSNIFFKQTIDYSKGGTRGQRYGAAKKR